MKLRRIGIVGYDGVQAIDVAGPADAFTLANSLASGRAGRYDVALLAPAKGPIRTESGLSFCPNATLSRYGPLDTIVVPGGSALRLDSGIRNAVAGWLRKNAPRARRVASVCTGVYGLAVRV